MFYSYGCEETVRLFLFYRYSNHKAFHSQLLELSDVAGQHETVAEEMISQITRVLLSFCNELKTEKKKVWVCRLMGTVINSD